MSKAQVSRVSCGCKVQVLMLSGSYDLIWTIPYPYDRVTEVKSEDCPGLDVDIEGLIVQH